MQDCNIMKKKNLFLADLYSISSKLGGWVKKSLQLVRTSINDENKIFATNNSNLSARLGDRCCDQLL